MSQSPRETEDVEPTAQSGDENEPAQQTAEETEGPMNRDEGLGYDFEVKEQDRWLPIANGE